jgi:hypothetical protein
MKRWNRKIVSALLSQKYPASERGRRFRAGLRKSRQLATSRRAVGSKHLTQRASLLDDALGPFIYRFVICGLAVPFPPLGADVLYFPVLTIGPRCS